MADQAISSYCPFTMNYIQVAHTVQMAYIDTDPIHMPPSPPVVFRHGNLVSSYLWRNIIPYISPKSRCIASGLIEIGISSKLPSSAYSWSNHSAYSSLFFSKILETNEKIVIVLHDYGSLFGLNWARLPSEKIAGLVLMEFLPLMPEWKDAGSMSGELQLALGGSPEQFRNAIIEDNVLIELFLQSPRP